MENKKRQLWIPKYFTFIWICIFRDCIIINEIGKFFFTRSRVCFLWMTISLTKHWPCNFTQHWTRQAYRFGWTSARFIESKFVDHIPVVALLVRRSHNQSNSTFKKYRSNRSAYFNKMKDIMKSNRLTQCHTNFVNLYSELWQNPGTCISKTMFTNGEDSHSEIENLTIRQNDPVSLLPERIIQAKWYPKLKIHFDEFWNLVSNQLLGTPILRKDLVWYLTMSC